MTIIDSKDLKFGPLVSRDTRAFLLGLNHVEDDRNSIFICLSNSSYVSICSECFDRAEGFRTDLTRLEKGQRALWLILLEQLCNCCFDTL